MPDMTFDPLGDTYLIRPHLDPAHLHHSVLGNSQHHDLVLLCGQNRLAYNSELLSTIFPEIRQFVQTARSCGASKYLTSEVEMFVTLAEVDGEVMKDIMDSVSQVNPVKFSREKMKEIRNVLRMLGVDKKLFSITKYIEEDKVPPRESMSSQENLDHEVDGKRKAEDTNDISVKKVKKVENDEESLLIEADKPETIFDSVGSATEIEPNHNDNCEKEEEQGNVAFIDNSHVDMKVELSDVTETKKVLEEMETKPAEPEDDSLFRCPLKDCPTGSSLQLKRRSEVLLHLSTSHYSANLLDMFPFVKGVPCSLCVEQRRPKVLVAQAKTRHLSHIGVNHQVVLSFLPTEVKELLNNLSNKNKKTSVAGGRGTESPIKSTEKSTGEIVVKETILTTDSNKKIDCNVPDKDNVSFAIKQETVPVQVSTEEEPNQPEYPPEIDGPSKYPEFQTTFPDQGQYTQESSFPNQPAQYPSADPTYISPYNSYPSQDYPQPTSNILAPLTSSEFESFPVADPSEYPQNSSVYPSNPSYHSATTPHYYDPAFSNFSSHSGGYTYPAYQPSECPPTEVKQEPAFNDVQTALNSEPPKPYQSVAESVDKDKLPEPDNPNTKYHETSTPTLPEAANVISCTLCTSKRTFDSQSELLFHLTIAHFSRKIVALHPFREGKLCGLCPQGTPFTASSTSSHVSHLGVHHKLALTLLPQQGVEPPAKPAIRDVKGLDLRNYATDKKESDNIIDRSKDSASGSTESSEVKCTLCIPLGKDRGFSRRPELLKHLTLLHFGKQLLRSNPFSPDTPCSLCSMTGRSFIPSKKEVWVCHVGVVHSRLFELLPREVLDMVKSMPNLRRNVEKPSGVEVPVVSKYIAENQAENKIEINEKNKSSSADDLTVDTSKNSQEQSRPSMTLVKPNMKVQFNKPWFANVDFKKPEIPKPTGQTINIRSQSDSESSVPLPVPVSNVHMSKITTSDLDSEGQAGSRQRGADVTKGVGKTSLMEVEDEIADAREKNLTSPAEVNESEFNYLGPEPKTDLNILDTGSEQNNQGKESVFRFPKALAVEDEFLKQQVVTLEEHSKPSEENQSTNDSKQLFEVEDNDSIEVVFAKPAPGGTKRRRFEKPEKEIRSICKTPKKEVKTLKKELKTEITEDTDFKKPDLLLDRRVTRGSLKEEGRRTSPRLIVSQKEVEVSQAGGGVKRTYNCRYCPGLFAGPTELKEHLMNHRDKLSQINQTPRKNQLINLRMGTPRK